MAKNVLKLDDEVTIRCKDVFKHTTDFVRSLIPKSEIWRNDGKLVRIAENNSTFGIQFVSIPKLEVGCWNVGLPSLVNTVLGRSMKRLVAFGNDDYLHICCHSAYAFGQFPNSFPKHELFPKFIEIPKIKVLISRWVVNESCQNFLSKHQKVKLRF